MQRCLPSKSLQVSIRYTKHLFDALKVENNISCRDLVEKCQKSDKLPEKRECVYLGCPIEDDQNDICPAKNKCESNPESEKGYICVGLCQDVCCPVGASCAIFAVR